MMEVTHLWNVGLHSIKNTAVHTRRFWASTTVMYPSLPWKIWHNKATYHIKISKYIIMTLVTTTVFNNNKSAGREEQSLWNFRCLVTGGKRSYEFAIFRWINRNNTHFIISFIITYNNTSLQQICKASSTSQPLKGHKHSLDFLTIGFLWGWSVNPMPNSQIWRIRPLYFWALKTGWSNYTPRNWVPVLVAFYETLQPCWDYSYPPVITRRMQSTVHVIQSLLGYNAV
jgi:hypothetical protein